MVSWCIDHVLLICANPLYILLTFMSVYMQLLLPHQAHQSHLVHNCIIIIMQVEETREWEEGKHAGKEESDEGEADEEVDKLVIYKQILELIRPGETVLKVKYFVYDTGVLIVTTTTTVLIW